MRWWNVSRISPSGLKLNYVWHLRQLGYALIPPTIAFVVVVFVDDFEKRVTLINITNLIFNNNYYYLY